MAQDFLYTKDHKVYAKEYIEIYIPLDYFETGLAINKGNVVSTFGLLFIRKKEGEFKLINVPITFELQLYSIEDTEITVHGIKIPCKVSKYMKDSYVFDPSVQQTFNDGERWVTMILNGKVPKCINYAKLIDIWWKNCEISNTDSKCVTKVFELVLAAMYRSQKDFKRRYGQEYGQRTEQIGYDYATGNVRDVVESLSTFSGMVFEDISRMITSGINNSSEGVEEPVSPFEKIIHY
jgi:hypothetical protein